MKGSIRPGKRPGTWELRLSLGRDPGTGRYRTKSRVVEGGKREAQRALAAFVTEMSGERRTTSQTTVGVLLDEWLDHVGPGLSPSTLKEYRRLVVKRVKPALGHLTLNRLKPADLDRFYRALSAEGLKPNTVANVHTVIRRALQQAVRWELLEVNPAHNASPPPVRARELVLPEPSEVLRLVAEMMARAPEMGVAFRVSAAVGARRGEVVGLRWSAVDLDEPSVLVARGVVLGEHGLVEKDTKSHATRRVALDPVTVVMLTAHRASMVERARVSGATLAPNAYVFSDAPDGLKPWLPDRMTHTFVRLRNRLGLRHVRLHDLRHFMATQLLTAGVDVRTVAGRLGHADASTTLRVYGHFMRAADQRAAGVMSDVLGEQDGGGA